MLSSLRGGCVRSTAPLERRASAAARTVMATDATAGRAAHVPRNRPPLQVRGGEGVSLPASERTFFEPRFGHDFGAIRVHNDPPTSDRAELLHARAFTIGTDIFFGRGQYRPSTRHG